jgi:hypothetical protein
MTSYKNGVEILLMSSNLADVINLPATAADEIEPGAFVQWDTSNGVAEKFAPADATENATDQNNIIGIAVGKVAGEIEMAVILVADVLMDSSNVTFGLDAVIGYNATTKKYYAKEEAAWNILYEPNITLTGKFAIFTADAFESGTIHGPAKLHIDGRARIGLLT